MLLLRIFYVSLRLCATDTKKKNDYEWLIFVCFAVFAAMFVSLWKRPDSNALIKKRGM